MSPVKVTVEDCLPQIPNHFELTLVAAIRARQLANGSTPLVDAVDNHKVTVTAMREISAGQIGTEILKQRR